MAAEEQIESGDSIYTSMMRVNAWLPRVAGVVTVLSSLVMISMSWKRRALVFHRLVLGKNRKRT